MPTQDLLVEGVSITVDYTAYPPCRGARERGTGLQLEPDEDAYAEINSITIAGEDITDIVSGRFTELVEEKLMDVLQEEAADYAASYGDYLYEQARDKRMEEE